MTAQRDSAEPPRRSSLPAGSGPRLAFGPELRRLRAASGLSLKGLAERVHYDKGHISKIENGNRLPTAAFARSCDEVLRADGQLSSLAANPSWPGRWPSQPSRDRPGATGQRDPDDLGGPGRLAGVARYEDLLVAPESYSVGPSWRAAVPGLETVGAAPDLVAAQFAAQLGLLRQSGQRMPAGLVFPVAAQYAGLLRTFAEQGAPSGPVLALAARFTEYAGWLAQEAGDLGGAHRWTTVAARLATQAGDESLDGYALVRHAELALYQGDAAKVVALADEVARSPTASARTRALAAHRRAQGYALAGAARDCDAALDEGGQLLADTGGEPASTVLGPSTVPDLDALVAGWCYYDLGRYQRAVTLLEPVASRLSETPMRLPSLFAARLALAYLGAGDLEQACAVGERALVGALATGSASAYSQLAELARQLLRWHHYPEARAMRLALLTAVPARMSAP